MSSMDGLRHPLIHMRFSGLTTLVVEAGRLHLGYDSGIDPADLSEAHADSAQRIWLFSSAVYSRLYDNFQILFRTGIDSPKPCPRSPERAGLT